MREQVIQVVGQYIEAVRHNDASALPLHSCARLLTGSSSEMSTSRDGIDRAILATGLGLHAVGDGETDPTVLAALADSRLRATPDQLRDAFGA